MRYLDAYADPRAARFLWKMMEESMDEPHTNISHSSMPTWEEHLAYLASRSRRVFLLIEDESGGGHGDVPVLVGFVSLTPHNEIGIRIAKGCRGRHYAQEAIDHVIETYEPLPGVNGGRIIANINPDNAASIALFTKLGAKHFQQTYRF